MKKIAKKKKKDSKCPDDFKNCNGPSGRLPNLCGNCYVEKNYGTRPNSE